MYMMDLTLVSWRRCSVLALPRQKRVVLFPVIVGVEKLLEPLKELEIVLELALHQLLHRDDLRNKERERGKERNDKSSHNGSVYTQFNVVSNSRDNRRRFLDGHN